MAELFVNVKNETRNDNNERIKFNSKNYSESVAFIEKSGQSQGDEIWAKKFYLFVPNDTNSEGKILTKTNIPENSGNAATINSEGDGRGEWDDYLSFEDRFSYGVEWPVNDLSTVSRIGNPLLHEDLPIQNEYRGCYYDLQNKKVLYWYDSENWQNVIPSNIEGNELYAGKYPAFNGVDMYYTKSGNTFTSTPYTGTAKSGIASKNNLVDYSDSNIANDTAPRYSVMVHTPKFYGKSGWYEKEIDGQTKIYNWVRISPMKIAGDWVEIPEMFVSAYHATIYNTDNLGNIVTDSRAAMLSGSMDDCKAVSVQNENVRYRGSGYNCAHDSFDNTPYILQLSQNNNTYNGIPRTGAPHYLFSKWCKNSEAQLLPYDYYKWIFFWNYVIEYCNFNSLDTFNNIKEEWTVNGKNYSVSTGGLGIGVSGKINNAREIEGEDHYIYCGVKCGCCNNVGNNTYATNVLVSGSSLNVSVPKWRGIENPFGYVLTELGGIYIKCKNGNNISEVYTTTEQEEYNSDNTLKETENFKCQGYIEYKGYNENNDAWYFIESYNPGTNGEMFIKCGNKQEIISGRDISIQRKNTSNLTNPVRKVAVGYRANPFNSERAGLGSFVFNDILNKNFYSYFGFRFVSIP